MPAARTKTTPRTATKTTKPPSKSHVATHPSWVDMIKECIIAHPDEARAGVSRPMIKKFVESKYQIEVNHTAASQLNRAITSGSEKGTFLLPKGPSGKVKLAPKPRIDASKENAKPPSKRLVTTKAVATKAKQVPARPAVKKVVAARPAAKAHVAGTKRTMAKPTAVSGTKKVPVKKAPATAAKTATAKKLSSSPKKSSTAKKGAAKKAVTAEVKKPAKKPKAAPAAPTKSRTTKTAVKAKSPTKAKVKTAARRFAGTRA